MKGKVTKFEKAKGWGFITPDNKDSNNGKDVFVHYSGIEGEGYRNLTPGDSVEFNIVDGKNGKPEARNVRKV